MTRRVIATVIMAFLVGVSPSVLAPQLSLDARAAPSTTVTVYSQVADGEVLRTNCSDWNTCRNGSSGTYAWKNSSQGTVQAGFYDSTYHVKRVFFYFDTSAIPAGAHIDSAILNVYTNYLEAGSTSVHIVRSTANTPLSVADFNQVRFVSGGAATPTTIGWMNISLNSTALNWIIKGGTTKLALVHNLDLNNSAPSTNNSLLVAFAEDPQHPPYLVVTYSTSTTQVELTGLEVTQAVQDWENSVVLIQDRPTFVRAHVRSISGTVQDVTAELIGKRGGNPLPGSPLQSSNQGGNVDVLQNPNRSQLNDSFYFELPASWRNGTVEFEFRGLSETVVCREHAGTDNDCRAQVTFTQSPAAEVRLVGIAWREGDTRHEPTWGDINEVVQQIESTFPIPRLDWDRPYDIEPVFFAEVPKSTWQFVRLNTMLKLNRTLDGCISSWPVNCKRYYLGVIVDPPEDRELNGMADGIPADVATAYLLDGFTLPHEFGHAASRYHTTCTGDEAVPDTNYPYPDGKISRDDSGDNAFFGFDINTKDIYGPSTADLMSYCRPRWSSDYTYSNTRSHLASRYDAFATAFAPLAVAAEENAVIVSGIVSFTQGTGEIASVYSTSSPVSVVAPTPGTYAIRFENSSGQELASYSFEPEQPSEGTIGSFVLRLPKNANTARIVLLHNGQTLNTRLASSNAPTVNVLSPNGGENLGGPIATVSWSATDLDGDLLRYAIQYSTDGGTAWRTLVSDWLSTTYQLNLNAVAGTNQGLLRVLASDGFHTAQDQSNATFTVAKHSPQASIQTPIDNSLYVGDQTIVLEGNAFDNEDGPLGDTALTWNSNLNGALGTGHSLAINASALAEGTHTITLSAQDSDSQIGTISITIQVYRARPTLPASLLAAPAEFSFIALEGSGQSAWQPLSIRNGGDGAMTWTVSAGQSWIRPSSLGGTAPTDILVAADPTGLSSGQYTGNITITAPGATNSPQTIQITLNVRQAHKVYLPAIMR